MNITRIIDNEDWDYANLSKLACEAGGPNELLSDVYEEGYSDGESAKQDEMVIITVLIGLACTGLGICISKTCDFIKKKKDKIRKNNKEEVIESASEMIVNVEEAYVDG